MSLCHNAAAVFAFLEYDVDDAGGTSVEVAGAGVVAVFHALDLFGPEVGQPCQRHLLAVDLQDGHAAVDGNLLQGYIHFQPWKLQHVEEYQSAARRRHFFRFGQHHIAVHLLGGAASRDADGIQLFGVQGQGTQVARLAADHQPLESHRRDLDAVGSLPAGKKEGTIIGGGGTGQHAVAVGIV